MFSTEKNGYSKAEVDAYIKTLQNSFEADLASKETEIKNIRNKLKTISGAVSKFKTKKDSISSALMAAVDKARQIEESSKNVYRLKIQQLNLLYSKWDALLKEATEKHPELTDTNELVTMVATFKESLKKALNEELGSGAGVQVGTDNDTIRALLSKMATYTKDEDVEKYEAKKPIRIERAKEKEETSKIDERPLNLRPIADVKMESGEDYATLADKFLAVNDTDEEEGVFPKHIIRKKKTSEGQQEDELNFEFPDVNESGFDLKEAINPTDELDEIMKSFDFYPNAEEE